MDIVDALKETERILNEIEIPISLSISVGQKVCIAIANLKEIERAIIKARENVANDKPESEETSDVGTETDS